MSFKRRIVDRVGRLVGMEIIPSRYAGYWFEERYLFDLLTALQADCVFDVGANVGQFGAMVRKCGFTGTILSFEPQPRAFASLKTATDRDAHWHAFNIALGSTNSKLPFHIMKSDVFSSFRSPTEAEDATFNNQNLVESVVDVPVERLDDFLKSVAADHQFSRPFLKMDTQGYDLEVIAGAGDTILQFVGLSSEIAMRRIYEDSPDMAQSILRINEIGFDFVNFFPVHPDRIVNPLEFNSYAVRRDLAVTD